MAQRTPVPPGMPWAQLAWRTGEMWLASSQVIPIRLARMAAAGPNPGQRDRREFHKMGAEKLQAAGESVFAVALAMQQAQLQFWARCWQGWLTPMQRGVAPHVQLARLASAALAPVHRAATANARRLNRVTASSGGRRS